MPILVGLGFHPPPGQPKTLSSLSVCLFVTLLNVRDCAPDFAMKALEYRNDSDPLDRGRFVVVHPCSAFSDCCHPATPLNAEVQKNDKNWDFPQPQNDKINRSRRNFADKRILWVCYRTPNLALIGKTYTIRLPVKFRLDRFILSSCGGENPNFCRILDFGI